MKKILFIVAICGVMTVPASANLWNTGVDAGGVQLLDGVADPHYTLTTTPSGAAPAIAIVPAHPQWVPNPANAAWIGPTGYTTIDAAGLYVFEQSFWVGSASSVVITGQWAVDNTGEIWLNGASTGIARSGVPKSNYQTLSAFQINTGFVANSINTLEFKITNGPTGPPHDGPTGLLVSGINLVPVPGAFLLGILGLGVAGARLRKKNA